MTHRRRHLPLPILLLVGLGVVLLARAAAAQGGGSPLVAPGLQGRAQADGSVRVIVELALPSGRHVPEGHLLGPSAVASQRRDITQARGNVLARLRGRAHRVLRELTTVPFVALEVGPDALAQLAASPFQVRRVVEDELLEPTLAQSVPVTEAPGAWDAGFDGTGRVVAVLDSGVEATHPFLAGKVIEEACYTHTLGVCPNGQYSQTGEGSGRPCTFGSCSHGTHVAGIAAGLGTTFAGVAPGASIMAVQIGSNVNGTVAFYTSDLMAGMERVYALRDVHAFASVNLSLGSGTFTAACDDAPLKATIDNLRSVGIATVIASGNSGSRNAISQPACISTAVSVGSTNDGDAVSSFSNVATFMSLFAPGESVQSSVPGGGFATYSGTSMATPHVAGAWAILRQAAPEATVADVLAALQSTGVMVQDTRSGSTGVTRPRIDIAAALAALGVTQPASGRVTNADGTGLGGVTMSFSLVSGPGAVPAAVTTAADGTWTQSGFEAGTTYRATPELFGRAFTPTSLDFAGGATGLDFTAVAGPADLTVTALSSPPATLVRGTAFAATDTTSNESQQSVAGGAGASVTAYFLTTDGTRASAVARVAERAVAALAGGAQSSGPVTVTVPGSLEAGNYVLIACADADGAVTEAAESNNCRAAAPEIAVLASLPDTTPPAAVTDLTTGSVTATSVALSWTAPGDDGTTGTATAYALRMSAAGPVGDATWDAATEIGGLPAPLAAGSTQGVTAGNLSCGTTYHFALRASDEVPNVSALSNAASATTAPCPTTLTVAAPNGGERWQAGTTETIRWTYTGTPGDAVRIVLLKSGKVVQTLAASAPVGSGGQGEFTWAIPAGLAPATAYKVRISSTATASIKDTSDASFTVLGPDTITVLSPNGGETWAAGSTQTIQWAYTGAVGSTVKIQLLQTGASATLVATNVPVGSGGQGAFVWTIPAGQAPASTYRIRVMSIANTAIKDVSDSTFTIAAP